ncbi:MAG TPA: thioredoxin-like domain-containing protein [Bryobacteraceae bacterium]|nr:thioredoxin-like domain-containing protein [Bryobacteraceae bacterium]
MRGSRHSACQLLCHGLIALVLAAASLCGQDLKQTEQSSLQQALGEAGNSPVEFVRAIEDHLRKFPDSPRRADLERALVKTAIDLRDDPRIIEYGERILARDPDNVPVLGSVSTALLHKGDKASAEKALEHARHFGQLIDESAKNDSPRSGREEAKRKDEFDRNNASAHLLQARAQGLLGNTAEAIRLAESSYATFPSVEAAREAARWLSEAGRFPDSLAYLADAFSIAGLKSSDPDSPHDRAMMAEIYRKLMGSETGLGDVILKAYDNTSALLAARRAQLRELDPNAQVTDPLHFTLSGVDGEKLQLASLLGKVVVLDFWATWCVPCRVQHSLYEETKARFKDSGDLVFLSIDTDEDRTLVKPFLESHQWTQKVYFDDGLQNLLKVASIPTTIIFGKKGDVVSRLNGFLPDRFVDMLTERIDLALGKPVQPSNPKGTSSQ